MEGKSAPAGRLTCRNCGSEIGVLSAIEAGNPGSLCPVCREEIVSAETGHTTTPQERFREILNGAKRFPVESLDEALLEGLPEDTRSLLMGRLASRAHPRGGDVGHGLVSSLRGQGYLVVDDTHGPRLSSNPTMGGLNVGLTAYDVVRLAAELDGGLLSPEERRTCPKCEATLPAGDQKCQWCGEILSQE